jgi:hypothetical protein
VCPTSFYKVASLSNLVLQGCKFILENLSFIHSGDIYDLHMCFNIKGKPGKVK